MKYCLEFGTRGGRLSSQLAIPQAGLARRMAADLVHVLHDPKEKPVGCLQHEWHLTAQYPRLVWVSATHYVALSLLDGVDRGPASARYWPVPEEYHQPRLDKWTKHGEKPV
jgi:hypothetical protein